MYTPQGTCDLRKCRVFLYDYNNYNNNTMSFFINSAIK